jgi:hypothetical protein
MSEPKQVGDGLQSLMAGLKRLNAQSEEARPTEQRPAQPEKENPAPPSEAKRDTVARIHPDKRGPLVLANALAEASGEKPVTADTLSYYSPELIQATLPHTDPKKHVWVKQNGNFTLTVASGYSPKGEMLGIPYGAFPRLVLAYIISQVIDDQRRQVMSSKDRRIELTSHFGTFLKQVGYTANHRGNSISAQRLKEQLTRLLRASISFHYEEGSAQAGRSADLQMHVAPRFELWWDFKAPEQDSLFGSWITLSEDFYNAILARPVPLKTEVLRDLHKDVLALDVYMWVSYRLAGMKNKQRDEIAVSYAALQAQFGTDIAEENYRLFRQRFRKALAKVAQYWIPPGSKSGESALRYEFGERGVTLYYSPMLVRSTRPSQSEDSAAIMAARSFDEDTRKQARLRAGTSYRVADLEEQYFKWAAEKGFSAENPPGNPRAHFFDFIDKHKARNQ